MARWRDLVLCDPTSVPRPAGGGAGYRNLLRHQRLDRLKDPSAHVIFFNHAFRVMAIDAERRNCYLTDGQLQPFDVILRTPDEEMAAFLRIYPDAFAGEVPG